MSGILYILTCMYDENDKTKRIINSILCYTLLEYVQPKFDRTFLTDKKIGMKKSAQDKFDIEFPAFYKGN